jgi:hypothetical protein
VNVAVIHERLQDHLSSKKFANNAAEFFDILLHPVLDKIPLDAKTIYPRLMRPLLWGCPVNI